MIAALDLAVAMTQITFPYLLFISLVSQLGGVLNALGKFVAAAAPIILNLCLITALLGLSLSSLRPVMRWPGAWRSPALPSSCG